MAGQLLKTDIMLIKIFFLGKIKFQLPTREFFGIPKPTTMVIAIFIIIFHLFLFIHNMGITFVHGKDTNRIPLQCHNITLTKGKECS